MKSYLKLSSLALLLLILGLFNNCDTREIQPLPNDHHLSSQDPTDTDRFVEADFLGTDKPDAFCGQNGYQYLLKEYFSVHCGVCHSKTGGFLPYFADTNTPEESYFAARYMERGEFLKTLETNRFCGRECSLNKEGETYKAIVEWLDNKWSCD